MTPHRHSRSIQGEQQRRTRGISLGLLLLLTGCALFAPQVKYTPFVSTVDIPPPVRHTILLTSATVLDQEVIELGSIEIRGRADPTYLLQKMQEKARAVGADAVYKIEGVGDLAPQKVVEIPEEEERQEQRRKLPDRPQIDVDRGISLFPRLVTGVAVRYK